MAVTAATTAVDSNTKESNDKGSGKHGHLEWREAVAGMFAASLSRTVMAPVERVKLIIQLQQQQVTAVPRLTSLQAARNVYTMEGLRAFWKGNLPSVLRVGGTSAINFTCLDYYKRVLVKPALDTWYRNDKATTTAPLWWSSLLSGGLAGATSTTLLYPLDFVRTRLALDHAQQFRSVRHVMREIIAKDGITGLYQGYGVALVGGVYYRILYLGGYDAIKSELLLLNQQASSSHNHDAQQLSKQPKLTWFQRVASAQFISLFAGTLAYPMDSIRRRMMMQAGLARHERRYRNGWHCFRTVLKQEGVRGFFLGLAPNIVRSLGGAMLLVAYDTMRTWLEPAVQ